MPESAMHATTESAEITAQLPSKPRSDIALTALYSAALGPVHLSRYLPIFARFDEAGRTTTSWNWAASLCTLNWMVFRQMWGAALVYVAAAEGVALLVFGVGRPLLEWPEAVEWGGGGVCTAQLCRAWSLRQCPAACRYPQKNSAGPYRHAHPQRSLRTAGAASQLLETAGLAGGW